jgi:uncharacterized protein (TIGR03790 family)
MIGRSRHARPMRKLAIFSWWLAVAKIAAAAPPPPQAVAILYNSAVPESRQLAETYANARSIPATNLVGLEMPTRGDISRDDYNRLIRDPLRTEFEKRNWWRRDVDANGVTLPVETRIVVLVTMRGVPLRIQATPKPADFKPDPADPVSHRDEAAVDSELALFGVDGVPLGGVLKNQYFQSEKPIIESGMPFLLLTSRIDAPTLQICERMIRDAIETEKTGLWGWGVVDIANKFPQGDAWLEGVVKANIEHGIPTLVDRFNDTLPTNYPLTDVALYHGWYDTHVSGPFLGPRFEFRKGAVAMHLHSFSGSQLINAERNWSAPLLARGAAATIGNVQEPYLHLTHHFDVLQQRLLAGFTLVEAAWAALPATSWQAIVVGDPLYRPFVKDGADGVVAETDRDFRALRMAHERWGNDAVERRKQLAGAAERTRSGILTEAIGLDVLNFGGNPDEAGKWFRLAKTRYAKSEDKLRQDLQLIAIERQAGRKDSALRLIKEAKLAYGPIPESEALAGWQVILDPPPPPPADPTKVPAPGLR